jgi:hypothetical protein
VVKVHSDAVSPVNDEGKHTDGNFCGMIELTGGVSRAKYIFGSSPNTQVSLLFGSKRISGQNIFFVVGIGYNGTNVGGDLESVRFLPLFIRLQNTLNRKRTAPYLGMDAGYAFALDTDYQGGVMIKISAGITHKLTYRTVLFAGVYAGVQSLSGSLTETNELGVYSYPGKTTMQSAGIKVGMSF